MNFNHNKAILPIAVICIAFTASGAQAQERPAASRTFTDTTKEFLSDPARTGSLLGSILAGAAVANPLAPLVGSVAGFMIGKSSAFSKKDSKATRQNAYAERSLMPDDGLEVTSLTGLTGTQARTSEQSIDLGLPSDTGSGNPAMHHRPLVAAALPGDRLEDGVGDKPGARQTEILSESKEPLIGAALPSSTETGNLTEHNTPIVVVKLPVEKATGSELQKQLAEACSDIQPSQAMSLHCYYYSQ